MRAKGCLNRPVVDTMFDDMVAEFGRRRKYIVSRLNDIDGISCSMPGGAFYVFPNVSGIYGRRHDGTKVDGSDAFAEFVLSQVKVALVPASGFGADNCVRLSSAT